MSYVSQSDYLGNTVLLTVLPGPDDQDPIPVSRVDYINRPSGKNAGDGDVLISHGLFEPVEDDYVCDHDAISQWLGGKSFSFTGGFWKNPYDGSEYNATHIPYGVQKTVMVSPTNWTGTMVVWKYQGRSWSGAAMFFKITVQLPRFSSEKERDDALSSSYAALYKYRSALTIEYYPPLPPYTRVDGFLTNYLRTDVSVKQRDANLGYSQLDTFIEERMLGIAKISDSGVPSDLFYRSYYDAIEKLPVLHQNLIANVLEAVHTLASFANGIDTSDLRNVKKLAKELWLGYRYSYQTTISDMEEVSNALARLVSVCGKSVSTYGHASDGTYDVSCCVSVVVPMPDNMDTIIQMSNARLSFSNVWDMIPYSFVVDWFLRIGDVLEDLQRWIDSSSLNITNVWYSVWVDHKSPGATIKEYCRFSGKPPSLPYFYSKKVGTRTIGMRIADTISLFAL